MSRELCVGCGTAVPRVDGPTHRYMGASPGCWAIYGEVTARSLTEPGFRPVHQYVVDTYAVQHPGTPSNQAVQSVAVHLISLYAHLVLGHRLERTPALLQRALRQRGVFRWLPPPSFGDALTVIHVHDVTDPHVYVAQ